MWSMSTKASDVVAAHRTLLGVVRPEAVDACPGLLWCDEKLSKDPDLTVAEILALGEKDVAAGRAEAAWPYDLLIANFNHFDAGVRARIISVLPASDGAQAIDRIGDAVTEGELAAHRAKVTHG